MSQRSDAIQCASAPLGFGRAVRKILERLAEWRRRSEQRSLLAAMNDRMLKDIGITRADAMREVKKPFWLA